MPSMPRISVTRRKDNPEAVMSIGDHLRELRNRLVISALGILIGAVAGYVIYKPVYNLITLPITQANANGGDLKVNFPTILSSFCACRCGPECSCPPRCGCTSSGPTSVRG